MSERRDGGKEEILNVRAVVDADRPRVSRFVEDVGHTLASPWLFLALLAAHLLWVLVNLHVWPWRPWDPYPFTFLATIASVEAPFIALMVLMYQRRNARIEEVRTELILQAVLHSEREISMALRLLSRERQGGDADIEEERLEEMQEPLDPKRLLERLREELGQEEGEKGKSP